jgi:hypothetical protein
MASANDYLHAIERCTCSSELATSEQIKQIWLTVADSYRLLSAADKTLDGGALIDPNNGDRKLA